jgi:alpha-amylase
MQEAIRHKKYHFLADRDNRPNGLIGLRPMQAATFVDNHDTGSTQQHWKFPTLRKLEGYAYILTHPGTPTVFWEHMYEDSDSLREGIETLIELRKRSGITAGSEVTILLAAPETYIADVRGTHSVVRCKLGPQENSTVHDAHERDGWELVLAGMEFSVWERYSYA